MVFFPLTQPVQSEEDCLFPKSYFLELILLFTDLPFSSLSSLNSWALRRSPFISGSSLITSMDLWLFKVAVYCQIPLVPFHLFTYGIFSQPNSIRSPRLSCFFLPSWSHYILAHTASPASSYPSFTVSHTHFGHLVGLVLYWSCCFTYDVYSIQKNGLCFILYIIVPSRSAAHSKCSINI